MPSMFRVYVYLSVIRVIMFREFKFFSFVQIVAIALFQLLLLFFSNAKSKSHRLTKEQKKLNWKYVRWV